MVAFMQQHFCQNLLFVDFKCSDFEELKKIGMEIHKPICVLARGARAHFAHICGQCSST